MKVLSIIITLFAAILLTSCGGSRKCNGQRGTRVEMGTMQANHGK